MHELLTACGSRFYVSGPLPLSFCSFATFGQLHTAYGSGDGRHYFDRATLAFFGSTLSGFRMVSGTNGAGTIERQRKAPASMRFRVELWVTDSAGLPDPLIGCSHATEAQALACVRATFAALSAPVAVNA